jgi:hypothetical protein
MSPLRHPAKAGARRSLIAVSVRLVKRGTPGPGAARELQSKSHFKGEAKFRGVALHGIDGGDLAARLYALQANC